MARQSSLLCLLFLVASTVVETEASAVFRNQDQNSESVNSVDNDDDHQNNGCFRVIEPIGESLRNATVASDLNVASPRLSLVPAATAPVYTIQETPSACKLAVNVPGVKPKDLDVTVDFDERTLRVQGVSHSTDNGRDKDETTDHDHHTIQYLQKWSLDASLDLQSLVMQYRNGVVQIVVVKTEPEAPVTTQTRAARGKKIIRRKGVRGENNPQLSVGRTGDVDSKVSGIASELTRMTKRTSTAATTATAAAL